MMEKPGVTVTRNHSEKAKLVTWDDCIKKIDNEFKTKTIKIGIADAKEWKCPIMILHNENLPKTIFDSVEELKEKGYIIQTCHVYTSFGSDCVTFGRHKDKVDVLITQAVGSVSYKFDDESIHRLEPGDSLFIPKGVYHDPYPHSPRITLSTAILNYEQQ